MDWLLWLRLKFDHIYRSNGHRNIEVYVPLEVYVELLTAHNARYYCEPSNKFTHFVIHTGYHQVPIFPDKTLDSVVINVT